MSVPNGLVLSLSCPTVTTCIGLTYVQPAHTPTIESFRTSDAGYRWQSAAVGVQGVAFDAPSCADVRHCVAIVQTTPMPDPSVPGTLVALSSVDGGQTWQSGELPASISTDALGTSPTCPTDMQCWVSILLHQDLGSPGPVIASTTDGGQTWQQDPSVTRVRLPDASLTSRHSNAQIRELASHWVICATFTFHLFY